jgi:3-oxoacyl-[acyl-carrier protein] reductase
MQKTAIITGSSRGIGAAVAIKLAHDGFAVVINYAGNAEAADAVKTSIQDAGGKALCIKADVSHPD